MTVKVTWHGDKLLKLIRKETPGALFEAAQDLATAAAARAPRRSGELAESAYAAGGGKSTYRPDKTYRKELQPPPGGAVAAFASFYARFVELGTARAPAQPFMRPALDEKKLALGGRIVARIGKGLK